MSETVSKRLARLERSNRRMKLGLACAILAAVALGAIESQSPRSIVTDEIVVKDPDGNTVAKLSGKTAGAPVFLLMSPDGEQSVSAVCRQGLALVRVKGSSGKGAPEAVVVADRDRASVEASERLGDQ